MDRASKRRAAAAAAAALITVAGSANAAAIAEVDPTTQAARGVISYPAAFFAPMGLTTAYDMVLRVPGFAFDRGSVVRGFAGAVGNVLIDGQRPASKTDDLISVLRRVPASQVARIDLIRGGAPGIDMLGKTVVVNVVRRNGGGMTSAVTFAGSKPEAMPFDPQLRLEGKWRGERRTLEASLQVYEYHDFGATDGPHDHFSPSGALLDVSPMHNAATAWQNIATAAVEAPLAGGRLRLNLTLEDQPYDNVSIDHFVVAGEQVERDRQDSTDGELGLRYEHELAASLMLEAIGLQHVNKFGSNSTFDQASGRQVFRLSHLGGESIGRLVLHWRPTGALAVDAGGEAVYNWVDTRTSFTANGVAIPVPAGDVQVREVRGEAFVNATWRPRAGLTLEPGVRVEQSTISSSGDVAQAKTLVYVKPRLAATWSLSPVDQLRLRIEREVGQIDFGQFVAKAALNGAGVTAGNPDLRPQQDWVFEAAYERRFGNDGVASLTVQRLALSDVVDRAPVFGLSGVFDQPANIGDGTETTVSPAFNLRLDRFGLTGASIRGLVTWRFSQVVDPTTHQPRDISALHGFDGDLHFSQDLPRWNLAWGLDSSLENVERTFRFNEIDTRRRGTSSLVFVGYQPRPNLNLRVELDNFGRRPLKLIRDVFAGPRDRAALSLVDYQDRRYGMALFFRARKTFG
jgi:hypothetical protein